MTSRVEKGYIGNKWVNKMYNSIQKTFQVINDFSFYQNFSQSWKPAVKTRIVMKPCNVSKVHIIYYNKHYCIKFESLGRPKSFFCEKTLKFLMNIYLLKMMSYIKLGGKFFWCSVNSRLRIFKQFCKISIVVPWS